MHKQLKNLILVVITILLLVACGPFEPTSAPAPELIVRESPTETPESVVIAEPTEDTPTALPSDGFAQYIGLSYPPFPVGLSQDLSMLIQDSDGYGLWLVTDGGNKMLWLSKITHYDTTNGNPYWEVKDVLGLSNIEAGAVLIPDGCFRNGQLDNEILVAGKNRRILLAWRANTTLNVFEVIPTNGIECQSDKAVSLE